jgi:hypothetical protein
VIDANLLATRASNRKINTPGKTNKQKREKATACNTIVMPAADEVHRRLANKEKTKRMNASNSTIYRDFADIGIDGKKKGMWRKLSRKAY